MARARPLAAPRWRSSAQRAAPHTGPATLHCKLGGGVEEGGGWALKTSVREACAREDDEATPTCAPPIAAACPPALLSGAASRSGSSKLATAAGCIGGRVGGQVGVGGRVEQSAAAPRSARTPPRPTLLAPAVISATNSSQLWSGSLASSARRRQWGTRMAAAIKCAMLCTILHATHLACQPQVAVAHALEAQRWRSPALRAAPRTGPATLHCKLGWRGGGGRVGVGGGWVG